MKVMVLGLFVVPVLVISVLSIRPGGLRQQLRNARRRLKLALGLAGIYLLVSTGLRLLWGDGSRVELATAVAAAILGIVFLALTFERESQAAGR